MGKGEIACYEQFLLFPQCFQKILVLQTHKNQGLFGKGLTLQNTILILANQKKLLTHSHTMTPFDATGKQAY